MENVVKYWQGKTDHCDSEWLLSATDLYFLWLVGFGLGRGLMLQLDTVPVPPIHSSMALHSH